MNAKLFKAILSSDFSEYTDMKELVLILLEHNYIMQDLAEYNDTYIALKPFTYNSNTATKDESLYMYTPSDKL